MLWFEKLFKDKENDSTASEIMKVMGNDHSSSSRDKLAKPTKTRTSQDLKVNSDTSAHSTSTLPNCCTTMEKVLNTSQTTENKLLDGPVEETILKPKNAGKIFVGNLNFTTSSKDLETYFSRFGRVADAVVMRYPQSGKSRGFGFVTFADPANAKKAVQAKFYEIDGKTVEVRLFDSKPHKSSQARIYLGGLSTDVTEEDLADFFKRYGTVTDVLILKDKIKNASKSFGFVSFKEESSAEHCIADKFVFLKGRKIQIKKAEPRDYSNTSENPVSILEGLNSDSVELFDENNEKKKTEFSDVTTQINDFKYIAQTEKNRKSDKKLFVGGLNYVTTSEKLKDYFSRFGRVADAVVMRYPQSGKSRGFGFVTFADPANAKKAVQAKFYEIDGKTVEVRLFDSKPHKSSQARVLLEDLSTEVTEEDLADFFKRYGTVTDVLILHDKVENQLKRFGFVSFKEESSAEHCIADKFVFLKGKKIKIKKAEPRDYSNTSENPVSILEGLNSDSVELFDENNEKKKTEFSGGDPTDIFAMNSRNYLSAVRELFNKLNLNENNSDQDIEKLEKFLAGSSEENIENLIMFSDESEGNSSGESDDEASSKVSQEMQDIDFSSSLFFQDSSGLVKCTLCLCSLPNRSSETFLTHCKTAEHITKLKERFSSKDELSKMPQKTDPSPLIRDVFEKIDSEAIKKQSKVVVKPKRQKKSKLTKDFHAMVLQESIKFIQLLPENELLCQLCGVKIPQSQNLGNLMKNISMHSHSKKHFVKLLSANDLLRIEHEKNSIKHGGVKNKSNQSVVSAKFKEKKVCVNSDFQSKEKKKCTPATNTTSNDTEKKEIRKKKQNVSAFYLLCLPCNLVLKSADEFQAHKNSKTHSNSEETQHKCKFCEKLLFGSRSDFGEHYSQCVY